ncbi:hypothetical protein ONZ45_g3319 [Pleurotus djamor]|nr:hypothetical protein ONZ45_g3319 [Pleurotus djamor]
MKYSAVFAFAAIQATFFANAAALFAVPGVHTLATCYKTDNHGSKDRGCSPCKAGHVFSFLGPCDIGYACCKGFCCKPGGLDENHEVNVKRGWAFWL